MVCRVAECECGLIGKNESHDGRLRNSEERRDDIPRDGRSAPRRAFPHSSSLYYSELATTYMRLHGGKYLCRLTVLRHVQNFGRSPIAFYFSHGMEYPAQPGQVAIKESGAPRARARARSRSRDKRKDRYTERERERERACEMHQRNERSPQAECNWITTATVRYARR